MSLTAERAMAKAKGSERNDIAVKIDKAVVAKARLIAAHRDISVAQFLSDLLKVPVDREYAKMIRELESSAD